MHSFLLKIKAYPLSIFVTSFLWFVSKDHAILKNDHQVSNVKLDFETLRATRHDFTSVL